MKIFISSVIRGFEPFRDAGAAACRTLKHQAVRAEDFGASSASPQRVCLAGVRESDAVVLLLGERYGEPGDSGLSPTHEEYLEARDRKDVLVFVQSGVTPDALQAEFIREVQGWAKGRYTAGFSDTEELREALIGAIHELELARRAGPVDETEMELRLEELIPRERDSYGATLVVAAVGAPRQQVIRPAQIEAPAFEEKLLQLALFGSHRVFERKSGSEAEIKNHALLLRQDRAEVLIDELGSLRVAQQAQSDDRSRNYLPVLVEEEISDRIATGIRFIAEALDLVDPIGRVSSIALVASLAGANHLGWMTRAEQARSRSVSMGMSAKNVITVRLSPLTRPRPALGQQAEVLAEDLMVLLRRQIKR